MGKMLKTRFFPNARSISACGELMENTVENAVVFHIFSIFRIFIFHIILIHMENMENSPQKRSLFNFNPYRPRCIRRE